MLQSNSSNNLRQQHDQTARERWFQVGDFFMCEAIQQQEHGRYQELSHRCQDPFFIDHLILGGQSEDCLQTCGPDSQERSIYETGRFLDQTHPYTDSSQRR